MGTTVAFPGVKQPRREVDPRLRPVPNLRTLKLQVYVQSPICRYGRRNNFAFSVQPEQNVLFVSINTNDFFLYFLGTETASVAACRILGMEFDFSS